MLSDVKCIPATPMTFNNSVNLTDQFMLKAGCKYIYKQSVAGMVASRRNFHESCIYTDIVGYHQSTGHSWDRDRRTWKN